MDKSKLPHQTIYELGIHILTIKLKDKFSFILNLDQLRYTRPILQNIHFFFEPISSPARDGHRPEIPVYNREDNSKKDELTTATFIFFALRWE